MIESGLTRVCANVAEWAYNVDSTDSEGWNDDEVDESEEMKIKKASNILLGIQFYFSSD